ncbi:MAG TPA: hypothetical protein VKN14_14855 [Flavobacteriaceae bacterium]|nr:hypothetical protein [Flavobacteriaceae bacterium]
MPSKQEFKDNIWPIWKIVLLAKECYQFSFYLHKPETKRESEYIAKSQYFGFIRHILWRCTVIELSKLFNKSSKRDKYNIYHFISKLKSDGYFGGFKIDSQKISDWNNQLVKAQLIIDKVLKLRDKVYAHTDYAYNPEDLDTPTFEETKTLIDIVENVIQEIYSTAFDSAVRLETPLYPFAKTKIIKTLAKVQDEHIQTLIKDLNKNK